MEAPEKSETPSPNKKRKSNGRGKKAAAPHTKSSPPVAEPARRRPRHLGVFLSFLIIVLAPTATVFWYLNFRAVDQYASTVGFSVRTEEIGSAVDFLGGISQISSGSSSDTDILYEFIQSQQLVSVIDSQLDLRKIYSRPENDPVFAYSAPGSIEDLLSYWGRMVDIFYDAGTGLIEIRALAFDPHEAQAISRAIFAESSKMINELSTIAREDATRYAEEELEQAVERLKKARQDIIAFRNEAQIVDPSADIQAQMGLLNMLQQQQAEALIELDLLRETARQTDPRIVEAQRKIAVIQARIKDERRRFGVGSEEDGESFSILVSEYEGLTVEREFAESAYLSALAAYDSARAEAQRQSRYLAAYVKPTLAETSEFPQHWSIIGFTFLFLFLIWFISVLIFYSIRDRR